jgi:glycosyltransferase involved in cell wall biosynthesis
MKITIVQGAFLPVPPKMGGAVEKIWYALGKSFAQRGHEVTHISRAWPPLSETEVLDGVKHIRVPGSDTPSSLVRLKWRDLVYSMRVLDVLPKSDILVTNTFWLPMLASQAKHGKIYVHVARYPKRQMRFYRRAARLQAVSTHVGRAIQQQSPSVAERVTVIPNFVNGSIASPIGRKAQKQILYVGRIHPEKGLHILIEAFAKLIGAGLEDWRLCMVGPWELKHGGGGPEYLERLTALSGDTSRYIDWVGQVFDPEKLNAIYRQSSLFVYPSVADTGEASPLAPLEAMSQGCPVVVSAIGCFNDFLKPGINGWSFNHRGPNPAGELADTLVKAMKHPQLLQTASENAICTAKEYTLSAVSEKYLADFEEVIKCQ